MNEEQKNIETCLPEDILSEVANVPTDPQFRSLVEESFDPLQQQALQQAGYDGYKEVVMYHQPYTFTSAVAQMKSNLILLLRRLWRYPFGRGTTAASYAGSASASSAAGSAAASAAAPIRSLADMWQHYITRLKGNAEYGIPSRLSSITDLPSAPALLADRKIVFAAAPDGIGLPQLLCNSDAVSTIDEIEDPTYGWTMDKPWTLNVFPLKKLTLGCALIHADYYTARIWMNGVRAEELNFPHLKKITRNYSPHCNIISGSYVKVINMPELEEADLLCYTDCGAFWGDNLEEINMPKLKKLPRNGQNSICTPSPKLRKIVFGTLEVFADIYYLRRQITSIDDSCPNLIHFEIGAGTAISLNLSHWLYGWSSTPNALDASRTDLIEEGSTATNNLQQFLQNFRDYIALRLTDKGAGKTLTLSQEVRNAIHAAEDEYGIENIIITKKGWTISPAPN